MNISKHYNRRARFFLIKQCLIQAFDQFNQQHLTEGNQRDSLSMHFHAFLKIPLGFNMHKYD